MDTADPTYPVSAAVCLCLAKRVVSDGRRRRAAE
jgi:hypothetical protein